MDIERLPAILWVMLDVDPDDEHELYRWYDEEHIPIRMDLPGWLRTRRFLRAGEPALVGADTGRKHLTIYEVESTEAFLSPEYAAQYVQKTPWSEKVVPTQRNVMRSYYREVGDVGLPAETDATGAAVVVMFDSDAEAETVATWFDDRYRSAVGALPAVRRVRHYTCTEVPWPGGKWMQPEAGRQHLLVHELDDPSVLAAPVWSEFLSPVTDPAGPVAARRPLAAGYVLASDQSAPSGWFQRTGGAA